MEQIQINKFVNTGIYSEYNSIISIEIEDKPFAEGGFGEVYNCISINGNAIKTPQVIKIYKENFPGSADDNAQTIVRLQEKLNQLNVDLKSKGKSLFIEYPAFKGIPQFSFEGFLNGQKVKGFSSDNLTRLGFDEFENILSDNKLLDKFYNIPVERRIYFAFQLASAFKVLEEFKYIHADLKEGAIFLNLSTHELAIIDYDSGVITENTNDKPKTWGTIGDWVAPEIFEQLSKIKNGEKIQVDFFTDRWSVAIGINYLISGVHPLFFLKNIGTVTTELYFRNQNHWPEAVTNSIYFKKGCDNDYNGYIDFLNTNIPQQIKEKMATTINFGYKNPVARTSYSSWEKALQSIQKPPIVKFLSITKKEIIQGENIVFAWNVENAVSVEIENIGTFSPIDRKSIKPDKSCTYIIKFKGYYGELVEKINVKVTPAPFFKIVEVENTKIKKGNSTSLKWEIENTSKINLWGVENDSLLLPSKGHKYIKPYITTTYKFEAIAIDNTTVFERFVTVEVFEEGKISFFNADRQFVLQTMSVELSWETFNAIKVEIEGIGEVELSGSLKIEPFTDTKYKLIVTDQFGKIEQTIQIKILPLPLIEKVIVQTPNIVNENILRINIPDFSNVSNTLPKAIELREFDFNIKIDSKRFIPTPKFINLKYEMKRDSFIEKIQRIFDLVKKEFITNKNRKYVSKK